MFTPPTKLCPKIQGIETLSHAYGAYIESLICFNEIVIHPQKKKKKKGKFNHQSAIQPKKKKTTSRLRHTLSHPSCDQSLHSKPFSWGWMMMMICTLYFIDNTAAPKIRITWQIIMVCFNWPNVRNGNTTIFINIFYSLLR